MMQHSRWVSSELVQEIEEKKKKRTNIYLQWHMDWLEWAKGAKQMLSHMEATCHEDLSEIEEEVTWSRHCANMALKAHRYLLDPTLEGPKSFLSQHHSRC